MQRPSPGVLLVIGFLLSLPANAVDRFGDPLPEGALQRLGTNRLRYSGIGDLRYLPDGRGLVAVGGRVEIWDLAAGQLQESQPICRAGIRCVVVRKDGRALLVADSGGSVREWCLADRRELRNWGTGQASLSSACYSPDGTRVLTCGSVPPTIKEWDLAGGRQLVAIEGRMHAFREAIYAADGRSAFVDGSAGSDPVLAHYDLKTGALLKEWQKDYYMHERSLVLSADGYRLLAGSRHMATEWQIDGYRMLGRFTGHHGHAVVSVAYGKDPDQVLTGSRDGSIRRWSRQTKEVRARWFPHANHVTHIQVSPDGRWVLSYGGGSLAECSIQDGRPRLAWDRHSHPVQAVAALPNGRAVSGSADGTLRVWDMRSGRSLMTVTNAHPGAWAVAASPDGARIAAGCKDGVIREFAAADGRLLRELKGHTGYVRSLKYLQDTKLVSSADDGSIRLWDADRDDAVRTIGGDLAGQTGHRGGVLSLDVSGDGKRLLSGGRDGTMRLWSVADGRQLAVFGGHRGWVQAVAFAGNGRRAVSGSRDGFVRQWDLPGGRLIAEMEHGGAVNAVACFGAGARTCAGGQSGVVSCWDLATGKQLATFCSGAAINALAVGGDSGHLLSAGEDTTVLVWQLPE